VVCFHIAIIRFTGGDKMKTMIWIDDRISRLPQFGASLFPILWEHDVCNRMILIGNNYKEDEPDADRDSFIDRLYEDIIDLFYQFCYEKKGVDEKLDDYYKIKKGIRPERPENLPDNSSCDDVVRIFDSLIQNNKSGGTVVVGVDVKLNKDNPRTVETLTDEILGKLSGRPDIKIFIYSFYGTDDYPDINDFREKHNQFSFFNGKMLVKKDSDEQKMFFRFFGIER
jgi:hypothetical protein